MTNENNEIVRKASLPPQAGMSNTQLRRYNNPNNDALRDDPIYSAFPELREKMENRTLTEKEYSAAQEAYNAERIFLLLDADTKYERAMREKLLRRDIEASRPWIVEGTKTWLHPIVPRSNESRYATH